MKAKFDKNYYEDGISKGLSCYENYRWIPELTYPMAHKFYEFLNLKSNLNVLEYGCAHGYLVKCLNDYGVNTYGVDISDFAIKNCLLDVSSKVTVIKKNNLKEALKKLKFTKDYFDWVVSKDVFEHIPQKDLKQILKQLTKLTKNLFVIVPLGDKSKYRIKQYHLDRTHVIIKNENWWSELFENNGFKVKKMLYKVDGIKDKWFKINKRGNGFFVLKSKIKK